MGKKSLGRGMDNIAEIFLSETEEGESERNFKGLSSIKIRDKDCSSCIHLVLTHSRALCKVFTIESEKYGVPFKNTISLSNGNYCQYFEQSVTKETDRLINNKSNEPDLSEIDCNVEEIVRIDRKIAYPDNENTQKL